MALPAPSKKRERDFCEREYDFPRSSDFTGSQRDSIPRLTDALMTEDAVRGVGLMPHLSSGFFPNREQVNIIAHAMGNRLIHDCGSC